MFQKIHINFTHNSVYPYLCQALANIVTDRAKESLDKKEYFVSFVDVSTRHRVRELKCAKIGSLVRISGQVVRTHPVHPELVSGTFICLECQTVIPNIEQQFKVSCTNTSLPNTIRRFNDHLVTVYHTSDLSQSCM